MDDAYLMSGAIIAVMIGGVAGTLLLARRSERKRAIAIWRHRCEALAGALDGEVRRRRRGGFGRWAVECSRGEARLLVACEGATLSVSAFYLVPCGPSFDVYQEGFFDSVKKEHGAMQDLVLDDARFDEHFVVECDDPAAMRQIWTAELRALLLEHLADARFSSSGSLITLAAPRGPEAALERVLPMLELVARVATADLFGVAALRALPGASYRAPEGPWDDRTPPVVTLALAAPVQLGPVDASGGAVTRARVEHLPPAGTRWTATIADGGEREGMPAELAAAEVERLAAAAGPAVLQRGRRHAELRWPTIVSDRERLIAGAQLVATLATDPVRGPYR